LKSPEEREREREREKRRFDARRGLDGTGDRSRKVGDEGDQHHA
jgi:hypothetical protein